jgi:hypothetical protein
MSQSIRSERSRRGLSRGTALLALAMAVVPAQRAVAWITGGEGNKPITNPGWPKGAAAIFNNKARIAWWEGPPFGGGQWHAECRGDARALSAVLADFARLDVKTRRVIVHDGVGHSFWLNPNHEPAKEAAARMDWMFMVWQPASWERLRKMPGDLNPTDARDADKGPPAQIDVYGGGNLRWSDVTVPEGLEVSDERLEAHGFTPADGLVLEGKVLDLATKKPIAAQMRLQRVEPQAKGGYHYPVVAETTADAHGRWVLKKAPAGWYRVVIEADGLVPRVAGYAQFDDQPHWYSYDCGLSHPAAVSGRVIDDAGQPLADVDVRFSDVQSDPGGRYESPGEFTCKAGADGRFRHDQLPIGRATIWLSKFGHCRPGLGQPIKTPAENVELVMIKSARLRVRIDFGGKARPEGYLVQIEPEGGSAVGTWGGSGNIDAHNEISFAAIPPGRYVLHGQPNPSSGNQQTKPLTIELKGGRLTEITISAVSRAN